MCEVLIGFCVKRPSEEGVPLGGGIELCGSSSCLGGLRILLNSEGILTLPLFHFTFLSRIHHSTETLAKSESLQYSTKFSNLPDNESFHIVLSPARGTPSSLGLLTQKTINTSHLLDIHLQQKCHPYVHTFQTSRQLNL